MRWQPHIPNYGSNSEKKVNMNLKILSDTLIPYYFSPGMYIIGWKYIIKSKFNVPFQMVASALRNT